MALEPFVAEIMITSFNFAPKGWALCNGQLLPINQNQALFSLLGTTYGGNGQTTFALPNLQGKIPIHMTDPEGPAGFVLGQTGGESAHTLTTPELPQHLHQLKANASASGGANFPAPTNVRVLGASAGAVTPTGSFSVAMYSSYDPVTQGALAVTLAGAAGDSAGGSQAHENKQPFLTLTFCIALQGIFPSRD